jgi:2-keto-4-pentenoate hydratase
MDHTTAAARLADARDQGKPPQLEELDGTLEEALALQLKALDALEKRGRPLGGWKVGLTSGEGRDLMGVGFRPFGFILADRMLPSGAEISAGSIHEPQVETELCLRLGKALKGANVTPAQCREAVAEVLPAFEINEMRVNHRSSPKLFVADGMTNWGIVTGRGGPPRDNLAQIRVTMSVNGGAGIPGPDDARMDDPFLSLSRLCAGLHRHGRGLEAGQLILTGSFIKQKIAGPSSFRGTFEKLGEVTLNVR